MNICRDKEDIYLMWQFIKALAPWQGGFYKRLVGMVKKSLRKGMGHDQRLLYWDKLSTLLFEVEAILNTRPLTYSCEDLNSSFVLTPAHFLTGGCSNAIPISTDDNDDVNTDYFPKLDSTQELVKDCKKQLQLFWRSWMED